MKSLGTDPFAIASVSDTITVTHSSHSLTAGTKIVISGSTGEVIYPYFINNPQTFPTTVGMYNDSNDLLAVAKLSKPIQKDFTKEALIRVKLDF